MDEISVETPETESEDSTTPKSEFLLLKQAVLAGARKRSKWRNHAKKAYRFVASHQWDDEDEEKLDEEGRPHVTFNRIAPIVNAVCGMEENSRQDIIYIPRGEGDQKINETLTSVAAYVRSSTFANERESRAFRDLAITGEGWTETVNEYDDEPDGKTIIRRINPTEMGVDAEASEENYEDSWLRFRAREMSVKKAMDLFGGEYDRHAIDAKWFSKWETLEDGGTHDKKDYPDVTRPGLTGGSKLGLIRVVQAWWWERRKYHMVTQYGVDAMGNPLDDEVTEMTSAEFKKYKQRADIAGVEYEAADGMKKIFYTGFLGAKGLIEKQELDIKGFPVQAMTGYYDEEDNHFYGIVHDLFDPQMWANKALSQIMQILNTNAKGGLLAETDAFVNQRKAEQDWADPTKIVWLKQGGLGKVKERTPSPIPPSLNDLLTFSISSLRDVSGVNLELLGQANREQAASLESQRRDSAMNILATLFASLRKYRLIQGRITIQFIWLMPETKLYRIVDKDQYQYIPLIKDRDVFEYDSIVDDTPSSPNQKQAIWAVIRDLISSGIPLEPPVLLTLLKYSPLPSSVVEEVMKAAGVGAQEGDLPPDQMKVKLQQAEQALKVMEQQLTEATKKAQTIEEKTVTELAKVAVDEYKAETERMRLGYETERDMAQMDLDAATLTDPTQGLEDQQGQEQQMEQQEQPGGDMASVQSSIEELRAAIQMIADQLGAQQQPPVDDGLGGAAFMEGTE